MNQTYLSKSKYCKAKQCNKILWLDKHKPDQAIPTANQTVLQNGTKVGEVAKKYFGEYIDIEYNKDLSKMIAQTEIHIKNTPNIITEASFNYNNNFCSVDILKNDPDGLEIYEVKSSTEVKEIYKDDISYQVYILQNLGYKIKSANIMYINSKYKRKGELDLKQLFKIENVTDIAFSKQEEIKNKILEINEYMKNENEQPQDLGKYCFTPYGCPYWNYCSKHLPENNVFNIHSMSTNKKLEFYHNGIYKFEDLINEKMNLKYKQQIEAELLNTVTIEKQQIKEFLKDLYYPLYFLDFETFQQAIPQYDNIRPFEQIPFQYSLHYIEKENAELKHTEFLAEPGENPKRKLAEKLVADIPENVCVLAYNMSFEKTVIKNLAEEFEDLREHLLKIHSNIKDLIIPFRKRMYYLKEMQGAYTIKKVLPSLYPDIPEFDYKNLSVVHNGEEASNIFAQMQFKTAEEQEIIRKGLLEYCKLDTLAMVKIWEKLMDIIK